MNAFFAILVLIVVLTLMHGPVRHGLKRFLMPGLVVGLFLAALLYPPWRITVKNGSGHTRSTEIRWAPIYQQPVTGEAFQSTSIAGDVFTVQLMVVAVIAGSTVWLTRKA